MEKHEQCSRGVENAKFQAFPSLGSAFNKVDHTTLLDRLKNCVGQLCI